MNPDFDAQPAAQLLAEAWRHGAQLVELPLDVRPRSLDEGYAVQDRLMALLGEQGAGWKLAAGSAKQKQLTGIGHPVLGRIWQSRLYRNGATVPLPAGASATIEFEIACVLSRDVRPEDTITSPRDVIAHVHTAFEIVLSRFVDRRAVGWPSFTADNAAFSALVLGDPIEAHRIGDVAKSLVVRLNGNEAARAVAGDEAIDPIAAVGDLIAVARERGMVLPQGSIVSTGTVSKPFNVAAPEAMITASFLESSIGFTTWARQP